MSEPPFPMVVFGWLALLMLLGTGFDVLGYSDFLNGRHPAVGVVAAIASMAFGVWASP